MYFAQIDQMEITCLELLYICFFFRFYDLFDFLLLSVMFTWISKSPLFYNKNDNNDDEQIIRLRSVMYVVEYKERHLDWLAKQNPHFYLHCVYFNFYHKITGVDNR